MFFLIVFAGNIVFIATFFVAIYIFWEASNRYDLVTKRKINHVKVYVLTTVLMLTMIFISWTFLLEYIKGTNVGIKRSANMFLILSAVSGFISGMAKYVSYIIVAWNEKPNKTKQARTG
jgi:hypothetical protein